MAPLVTPILLLAAGFCTLSALAGAPGANEISQDARTSTLDARAMVEALANRNPAPALAGDRLPDPVFAENYDWQEDTRVWIAFHALVDHAEDAWHEMVAHLDDGRYCLVYDTVNVSSTKGYAVILTVGEACREIIAGSLTDVYLQHLQLDKMGYLRMQMRDVTSDRKKLRAWCEARSTKSLSELQVEMCDWAILELEKGGFGAQVPKSMRLEWIAAIRSDIESLRASKKAFHFHGFGESMVHYTRAKAAEFRRKYATPKDRAAGEK